jgi:putative DNA primase/helicase
MATTADFAAAYVRKYGLTLVPLPPKTKRPLKKGWGLKDCLTTPEAAREYYEKNPNWNIGVALGPSRLVTLDVDNIEAMQIVCDEFGWNVDELRNEAPTVQGKAPNFRILFRAPEGMEFHRKSIAWPNKLDPDGKIFDSIIAKAVAAEAAGDLQEGKRIRDIEAEPYKRITVFEIRGAVDEQVQDVLPPSIHPKTDQPYIWLTKPNGVIPEPPAWLLSLWKNWDALKPQLQGLCPWAPERPTPKPAKPRIPSANDTTPSVIDAYDQAHSIEAALAQYGYRQQGKRWLSPHSSTGLAGVVLFDDKAWIHHASDPLCSDESGKLVGAFDLYRYYEHGGDIRKAVKAAAEEMGMKLEPRRPKPLTVQRQHGTPVVDAETGEITEPSEENAPIISNATPMKTAEVFHESLPEGGRIVFWRGEFFSWDGTRYVVRDRVYIEQRLYRFMAQCNTWKPEPKSDKLTLVPYNPKAANVNDVAHALRAVCYADLPDPQVWIEERDGDMPAHEIVAFRNGFFHYPTRALVSCTDRMWVTNALDFDYDSKAGEPREWLDFLASLWPSDPESVRALAEMFGYLLTDDTGQQKMFMLVGPPRSGKGTILRVLEALVGYHNRVSPSLASLGTQFGLQPLIGKRLALISDARLSGRADQQPIVENLLRISGEDALTIDRKNIVPWSGKLPARFVLATNELPAFSDASAALANRFLMFKLTKSFLGQENQGLTSRLLKELPGIVLWALDGLERLRHRGYFQRPSSADDLAADLLEQTSPVRSFVEDCCVLEVAAQCNRDDIFRAWKRWCELQGRDHPGTKVGFGRQLSAAFSSISRAQPREDGTRLNLYTGIRLTEKWKWEAQQV